MLITIRGSLTYIDTKLNIPNFLSFCICFAIICWTHFMVLGGILHEEITQFSSVQSLSCVRLFATPWTAALQALLSITNSQSLLKLMSIESVMPYSHLHPLLSPSTPTFNFPQHQGLFQWVGSLHKVAKVLEPQLQHQSFQWIFKTDFL